MPRKTIPSDLQIIPAGFHVKGSFCLFLRFSISRYLLVDKGFYQLHEKNTVLGEGLAALNKVSFSEETFVFCAIAETSR